MDTKHIKTMFTRTVNIMVILAVVLSVSTVAFAAPHSPFVGNWKATDVDGSDMSLAIGGKPSGPFKITLTDKYISFCDGEAGIVRGVGWLNEEDANLLEADLHVKCFTTGETLDFHLVWQYDSVTNTLSSMYENGFVTIWHRPSSFLPVPDPPLELRINYGHDWVEGFYKAGHTVWITVTNEKGTLKAVAKVPTAPREEWGWDEGFHTQWVDWLYGDGTPMESPPDIQPYDWVYGWVDNYPGAKVQIGEIFGKINLDYDSISGTIIASWIKEPVIVECLDWGSGEEPPHEGMDTGPILTDGSDPYSFSWAEIWDIQPGQDVGVAYHSPDGHWVANAITAPNPRIVASEVGDWLWVTEFYPGQLDISIYGSADEGADLLWSGHVEVTDLYGITSIEPDIHGRDLVPDNYVVVSDGVNQKELVLEAITVDMFDVNDDFMTGTAPKGRDVWVAAGPQEYQEGMWVNASGDTGDPAIGAWFADFTTLGDDGYDITEEMRTWSYAQIFDEDGDINEADPPPLEY